PSAPLVCGIRAPILIRYCPLNTASKYHYKVDQYGYIAIISVLDSAGDIRIVCCARSERYSLRRN
ncbi:MAG: hypothetical protein ACYSR4_09255, partial [Planctomycetota bacterium]